MVNMLTNAIKYLNLAVVIGFLFSNINAMDKLPSNAQKDIYLDSFFSKFKKVVSPESIEKEILIFSEAYNLYIENYLKPVNLEDKKALFTKANKLLDVIERKNKELLEGKEVKEIEASDLIDIEAQKEEEIKTVKKNKKKQEFYKKLNSGETMELIMDYVFNDIDAHTSWLKPETAKKFLEQLQGRHKGIGILFSSNKEENYLDIKKVFADGGASKAGLLPGDKIYYVDNKRVDIGENFENVEAIVSSIRGEAGTKVNLGIKRKDIATNKDKDINLMVLRGDYYIPSVEYKIIDKKYAYIQIFSFNHDTSDLYLKALRATNINNLQGLIIDLRDNPGGLLQQAVIVGDSLLSGEEVVSVKGRDEYRDKVYRSLPRSVVNENIPVIILLNGQSASASELLSAGFALNNRAIIIGDYSFGKWSVQTPFTLSNKSMFNITTQLFYGPFGNTFQGSGISPDIAILPNRYFKGKSADLTEETIALERKKEFREMNYSNWLKVDNINAMNRKPKGITNEYNCPKYEDKDYILGCALIYLKHKNINTFFNITNKIEEKRLKLDIKDPKDLEVKIKAIIAEVNP
jgi:carboxyl-terminal processing protease